MDLLDSIALLGTLVFAIPAAAAGLEFLLVHGEPVLGATLVVLAVALVVGQHYLAVDLRRAALEGVLARTPFGSDGNAEREADANAERK